MGLDIASYSHMEYFGPEDDGDCCYINVADTQLSGRLDGRRVGFYRQKPEGFSFSFRAGSYSGYNSWREDLCKAVLDVPPEVVWENPSKFKNEPFFELIFFSDCEGAIGPETSRKLAQDFENHLDSVKSFELGEWWLARYDDWHAAFRNAAQEGFVIFC